MKFIPRKLHAFIDIIIAIVALGYPWIFIEDKGVETVVLLVAGITVLCYSLLTKYELGIFRFINMSVHLSIEFFVGLFCATSPWLLDFGPKMIWPHVVLGTILVILSLCSNNKSISITQREEKITF
jgi:hypothetical protein